MLGVCLCYAKACMFWILCGMISYLMPRARRDQAFPHGSSLSNTRRPHGDWRPPLRRALLQWRCQAAARARRQSLCCRVVFAREASAPAGLQLAGEGPAMELHRRAAHCLTWTRLCRQPMRTGPTSACGSSPPAKRHLPTLGLSSWVRTLAWGSPRGGGKRAPCGWPGRSSPAARKLAGRSSSRMRTSSACSRRAALRKNGRGSKVRRTRRIPYRPRATTSKWPPRQTFSSAWYSSRLLIRQSDVTLSCRWWGLAIRRCRGTAGSGRPAPLKSATSSCRPKSSRS